MKPPVPSLDTSEHELRRQRWVPIARGLLAELYGATADLDSLMAEVEAALVSAGCDRSAELRAMDAAREADPGWFQSSAMIGYVAYAERFGGTLKGCREHLDYLEQLHVSYFHLMKVLESRPAPNDGGYAVMDYGNVDPALGSRSDLAELTADLRERGISLCLDLVLNHTAYEHPWAAAARGGSARHRDYYLVYPDRTIPDQFERTLPQVFPELAPGNYTWDPDLAAWVWTTFNTYQWDLNYANPAVFVEMLKIMLDLANLGVEILRLDAIAFTWKRLGTNCQNQPEAHLIAQAYRALLAIACPGVLLKAEAIVAPDDLVPYLGAHRLQRDECQIAYHNQLMVMIWDALATRDTRLATASLEALPPTPPAATWVTYLRCHDDIGWAVADDVAGTVGIDGGGHRAFLAAFYRGDVSGSFAEGLAFSSNAAAADERTCGAAASLAGITRARSANDQRLLDLAIRRLLLGYSIVFGFGGIPLIYMGDELAVENDWSFRDEDELADDTRWLHRPMMPWPLLERFDREPVARNALSGIRRLALVRRSTRQLDGGAQQWMHRLEPASLLAWERRHPTHGRFYGIANVSEQPASVTADALRWAGLDEPVELLGGDVRVADGRLLLGPLSTGWFIDRRDTPLQPARP